MVYYRLKNGAVLRQLLFVWFMLCGLAYESLYVQPLYRDDIAVLQSLDINPSFLRDPLFIQLKNGLATTKKRHYLQMLERGSLYIPTLRKMSGAINYYPNFVYAKNRSDFKVNSKKDHTILGKLENGEWEVYNQYKYGSGMLTPLVNSNSVMLLNKGKNLVKKGEVLKIIPFNVNFYNNTNVFNN